MMQFIRSDIFYLLTDLIAAFLFIYMIAERRNYLIISSYAFIILVFKLVVFVGLRPFNAGNDTIGYYYAFQALDGISTAREIGGRLYGNTDTSEFLYWPFAAFLKPLLGGDFGLFLIASISISSYFVYLGHKKFIDPIQQLDWRKRLALSIFFTYLVFLSFEIAYFGGQIRSAFGVPLAFLAYYYARQRKLLATTITFLLSIGFHNSTISILPLLLFEIFTPDIKKSRKMTAIIVIALVISFFGGRMDGIGGVIAALGGYYADRYTAYVDYEGFNITSVFTTGYFWIIIIHIAIFLLIGYQKIHFYAFYYMGLIFLFSGTPKISERYFAYILICLPFLLYSSFRSRFKEGRSLAFTMLFSYAINPLVVTSYAVTSVLAITSYIISR